MVSVQPYPIHSTKIDRFPGPSSNFIDGIRLDPFILPPYNGLARKKGGGGMQTPVMVRRVDKLGRVVIPIELRRMMEFDTGQDLLLLVRDGELVLRKFTPGCIFCDALGEMVVYQGKNVCRACLKKLQNAAI